MERRKLLMVGLLAGAAVAAGSGAQVLAAIPDARPTPDSQPKPKLPKPEISKNPIDAVRQREKSDKKLPDRPWPNVLSTTRRAEGGPNPEVEISDDTWFTYFSNSGQASIYTGESYTDYTTQVGTVDYNPASKGSYLKTRIRSLPPKSIQAASISKDGKFMAACGTDPFVAADDLIMISRDGGVFWNVRAFLNGASKSSIEFSEDNKYVFTTEMGMSENGAGIVRYDTAGLDYAHSYFVKVSDGDYVYSITPARKQTDGTYVAHILTRFGFQELTFTDNKAFKKELADFPYGWRLLNITRKTGEPAVWLLNNNITGTVAPNSTDTGDVYAIGTIIENTYGEYTAYYQPQISLLDALNLAGYYASYVSVYGAAYNTKRDKGVMGVTVKRYKTSGGRDLFPYAIIFDATGTNQTLLPKNGDWPEQGWFVDDVSYVDAQDGQQLVRAVLSNDIYPWKSMILETNLTQNSEWKKVPQVKTKYHLPVMSQKG